MSRILRRPMFRGGRVEDKEDLKVIDQMGIAKLANGGMAQRPGYKDGKSVIDMYESINDKHDRDVLKSRASDFSVDKIAKQYIEAFK